MEKEKSVRESVAESLLEHELRCPDYLTYVARPKWVEHVETVSDLSPDGGEGTAIVMSGPMVYENHFTRDTLRLYRRHYPKALIILSTWDDEDREYLDDLRDDQVQVVTRPKPLNRGINNSEEGRIPFHAGLCEAKKRQINYVFRTGTAQRIHAPNILSFLHGLLETFPLKCDDKQKKRIIASSHGTQKYLPFCISAMFMYGNIDDLLAYWDDVPDTRAPLPPPTDNVETCRMRAQTLTACYFATRYLKKIGVQIDANSIQDHWRILAERFCLLDREMLDSYWHVPVTSPFHATERREFPYTARSNQSIPFSEWLILYHTQGHHPSAPDWILDLPWGEKLFKHPDVRVLT